jgi:hypothetical protein
MVATIPINMRGMVGERIGWLFSGLRRVFGVSLHKQPSFQEDKAYFHYELGATWLPCWRRPRRVMRSGDLLLLKYGEDEMLSSLVMPPHI